MIFPEGVHFIFTSKVDYLFSHHPQYTAYEAKLTTRTDPSPPNNIFLLKFDFSLSGEGALN